MKKFMLLAAAVALVAALVAVPALAQQHRFDDRDGFFVFFDDRFDDRFFEGPAEVEQSFDQEAESGDIDLSFQTSNTGDNSNVCAPALQFGNTGNLQNQQGVVQYGSIADDIEFEGASMEFAPELATACDQAVQQSSAASSW